MRSGLPVRSTIAAIAVLAYVMALSTAPASAGHSTWTNIAWSTSFPQPYANSEAQGLALGGKLYSFGGFDSLKTCCLPTARAYRMDPGSGWTPIASMPAENGTGRGGVTHAGMDTDGTYIYWAGGYTNNATGTGQIFGTKEVWRYDPVANSYARMPDLPLTRSAGQLAYLDGRLHYFGGTSAGRAADVGEHWALDLSNQTAGWVTRAPMPNPRHHMGAAVVGGKIYAIGGQHGHDANLVAQDDVHSYDPLTNTWTQRADLPRVLGHISSATFEMDGRILVLGGEIAHNDVLRETRAYEPDTDAWTALTPLPGTRRSGVADWIAGVIYYTTGSDSNVTFKGVPDIAPTGTRRINFQPGSAAVPAGYAADAGLGFDAARGFGWVREDSLAAATHIPFDVSPYTRDRNLVSDQRLDTLVHMQSAAAGAPAAWEYALPAGTYEVTVSVGDAGPYYDSSHRVNVEGQVAVGPFVPLSANRFASGTRTVAVSDGRLTLDARGGSNTKLNYVEIVPATGPADTTPPAAPTGLAATAGDAQVALSWNPVVASDLAGYRVYRSTSTPVPLNAPISGSVLVTGTSFTDSSALNGTTYHYAVVAVDTSGNASTASASASATPQSSGETVDISVNFQPDSAPVPAGYTKDAGLAFDAARGFGWIREDSLSASHVGLDVSATARDRNLLSDQRLDTFMHMEYPGKAPGAWELVVPNGTYEVTVSVGEAGAYFDSTHSIRLEGAAAIAGFTPTSANRFAQVTQSVTVADGRLTVDAVGGTNTKLDFVTVRG